MVARGDHQSLTADARAKDPTGTSRLRARFRAEGDRRWQLLARTLRQALTEHDLLGVHGIGRLPHGDKASGFAQWLREELRQKVLGYDGHWLQPYVREAAATAQRRAIALTAGGTVEPAKLATMATLAASELRGIVEAAQQQITRAVSHGLMANASPTRIANAAAGVIKTMRLRTRAMAEYVVAKTHATATLSAFGNAGVTAVGIEPERLRKRPAVRQSGHGLVLADQRNRRGDDDEVDVITAGDDNVCQECQDLSDEGPYDLDTAQDLIPAHPYCRCAFVPLSDRRFAAVREQDARDYDPDEPRDPQGKWIESGGGETAGGGGDDKQKLKDKISDFVAATKDKHELHALHMYLAHEKYLKLDTIIVPKEKQGQGTGTRAMQDIVDFADEHRLPMSLTTAQVDPHHGTTSSSRLKKFYKRFGFKENKGRWPEVSDNMVRPVHEQGARDYDPDEPRVPAGSGEVSGEWTEGAGATYGDLVASRNITAKKAKAEGGGYARPDVAAMRLSPKNYAHDVALFENADAYPNFRPGELQGDTDQRAQTIIDHFKSNLRFIYDNAGDAIRKSGMGWYAKANGLAQADAKAFGLNTRSAAAVIAALSPQKVWNQNVYLAHQLMAINHDQQNHAWDDKMDKTAKAIWKPKDQELVDAVKGKSLGELKDPAEKAVWIRTYDEAHSDRSFRDFDSGEVVKTDKGELAKAAWQSIPSIANAVAAMDSKGDMKVISESLGDRHKVRSFYNNIITPNAPHGDVTVDTHAIGAALLRPLTGNDAAVNHGLGTSPEASKRPPNWEAASGSAVTGLKGTYALYADAYRAVAKEKGILPQQLQAITWQAKRAMFKLPVKKLDAVEHEWVNYHSGKQDLKQTQANVLSITRG